MFTSAPGAVVSGQSENDRVSPLTASCGRPPCAGSVSACDMSEGETQAKRWQTYNSAEGLRGGALGRGDEAEGLAGRDVHRLRVGRVVRVRGQRTLVEGHGVPLVVRERRDGLYATEPLP